MNGAFTILMNLSMLLLSTVIVAQSNADYYPLKVGNKWSYKTTEYGVSPSQSVNYYFTKEVVGDTVIENGIKYYIVIEGNGRHFERFDTLANEIKYYSYSGCRGNDVARYSLRYNDDSTLVWKCCAYSLTYRVSLNKTLSQDTPYIFLRGDGLVSTKAYFKRYIGLFSESLSEGGYGQTGLIGYRINGKEWGQLTNVKNDVARMTSFKLEQNYPNPFNPSTTIKYSLPVEAPYIASLQTITLKVYDMLGREVAVLVNEEKQSGNYEVKFDGRRLSSGIYYYKLISGGYAVAKKMILLK